LGLILSFTRFGAKLANMWKHMWRRSDLFRRSDLCAVTSQRVELDRTLTESEITVIGLRQGMVTLGWWHNQAV
jgi:hypothetical protein